MNGVFVPETLGPIECTSSKVAEAKCKLCYSPSGLRLIEGNFFCRDENYCRMRRYDRTYLDGYGLIYE
jgi:hypothetical protein